MSSLSLIVLQAANAASQHSAAPRASQVMMACKTGCWRTHRCAEFAGQVSGRRPASLFMLKSLHENGPFVKAFIRPAPRSCAAHAVKLPHTHACHSQSLKLAQTAVAAPRRHTPCEPVVRHIQLGEQPGAARAPSSRQCRRQEIVGKRPAQAGGGAAVNSATSAHQGLMIHLPATHRV